MTEELHTYYCKDCFKKQEQIERLEQENNAYKQSEQEAIEIIKELKEYSQRMENQRENYYKEYNNYRSALEEIREIAKDIIENDVYENSDVKAEKILTKINEVFDLS